MRKYFIKGIAAATAVTLVLTGLTACGGTKSGEKGGFAAKLDTKEPVTLEMAGFMGNFEALDQVVLHFNEIYPNVTVTYEQNNYHLLREYVESNSGVDIFMTTDENIRNPLPVEDYVGDVCADLSKEDIDFGAMQEQAISACSVDGALLRVPAMLNPRGMVVNKTLLEKEGLSIPQTWPEFVEVLEALKQKGYTPIQGSHLYVYPEFALSMLMNIIADDNELLELLQNGDAAAVEKVLPVFERLETIIDNGYTDYELNSIYPEDNYDQSILSFFKGDVPFWICNSECVSGMKKRESKSEEFTANPFEYEFRYVPLGEKGAYVYEEPWYGFSVNANCDAKDYAVEFMRFLVTESELNEMASIKGMPSAAKNGTDERYPALHDKDIAVEAEFSNDGSVPTGVRTVFTSISNSFGSGIYKDAKQAAQAFVTTCGRSL